MNSNSSPAESGVHPAVLVVGYGRQHHGDDILGPQIAAEVANWQLPQVKTCVVEQLTSKLAGSLAVADYAIFVDACRMATSEIRVSTVVPHGTETSGSSTPGLGHALAPASLLALTQSVYGRSPQTWWVEIPATDFTDGELSPSAQAELMKALDAISRLIQSILSPSQPIEPTTS